MSEVKKNTVRALIEKLMHPDFNLDDEIYIINVDYRYGFEVGTIEGMQKDEKELADLTAAYNAATDETEKATISAKIRNL